MHVTVELSRDDNGSFRALCPELGLRSCDVDQRQALDRLTSMIFEYVTIEHWHGREDTLGPVLASVVVVHNGEAKVLCSPRYLTIN